MILTVITMILVAIAVFSFYTMILWLSIIIQERVFTVENFFTAVVSFVIGIFLAIFEFFIIYALSFALEDR